MIIENGLKIIQITSIKLIMLIMRIGIEPNDHWD